ncbi:MAG: hypothetical protein U9Q21_04580 [Candidatus Auribacterota bacterium]|nr:hypothetical protein [Candidatus Auribacterota bacterium]
MKDIKELKKICQSAIQKNYSWWLRYVSRKLSIYFTALLIETNITANQVTFLSLIAGFIMVGFFAVGMPWAVLLGALSFQIFYIL